ncbi:MAG TPA: CBS domain-containing protein [Planctomycetota bacterium]|nr:CBS domain-containing protein [Planctomycetota bacterium]
MKVKDACTPSAKTCSPEANLAHAAVLMWENDCGLVPVVDGEGRPVGVITDRDIAIAVGTRGRPASEITVQEAMSRNPRTVRPEDEVRSALEVMETTQIRRLLVVDGRGVLVGVLSLSDIVRRLDGRGGPAGEEVLEALKAICRPHRLEEKPVAAPSGRTAGRSSALSRNRA